MGVQAESVPADRWHRATARALNTEPMELVARAEAGAVRASGDCAILAVADRMQPQAGWTGWHAATMYVMADSGKHSIRQRGAGMQQVFHSRG